MKKEYVETKIEIVSLQDCDIDCLVASVENITPEADGYWGDEWN